MTCLCDLHANIHYHAMYCTYITCQMCAKSLNKSQFAKCYYRLVRVSMVVYFCRFNFAQQHHSAPLKVRGLQPSPSVLKEIEYKPMKTTHRSFSTKLAGRVSFACVFLRKLGYLFNVFIYIQTEPMLKRCMHHHYSREHQ